MNTADLLEQAKTRYENLKHNERLIASVGLLIVVFFLWSSIVQSPMSSAVDKYRAEAEANRTSTQTMIQQVKDGKLALTQSPDEAGKKMLKELQDQSVELDRRMKGVTLGLIDPKMMAQVLSQLLRSDGQVKLLKLNSVDPISVEQLSGGLEQVNNTEDEHLFRHGIVMKFEATYPQTLNYLTAIEKLPWKLFWGDLNYQVKNYPAAEVTVKIYTLSDHKAWIGV